MNGCLRGKNRENCTCDPQFLSLLLLPPCRPMLARMYRYENKARTRTKREACAISITYEGISLANTCAISIAYRVISSTNTSRRLQDRGKTRTKRELNKHLG